MEGTKMMAKWSYQKTECAYLALKRKFDSQCYYGADFNSASGKNRGRDGPITQVETTFCATQALDSI